MLNIISTVINRTLRPNRFYQQNQEPTLVEDLRRLTRREQNTVYRSKPLDKIRFVVLDTETTGLHPTRGDEVISLGAVVVQGGRIREEETFHQMVNPGRDIPQVVTELTGITKEMVLDAPKLLPVLRDFLEFARGSILVGHTLHFDLAFLNLKLKQCGSRIDRPSLDTHDLSFLVDPAARNRSLDGLLVAGGIPVTNRHTALGDAILTGKLLLAYFDQLAKCNILTLQDLELIFQQQYQRLAGSHLLIPRVAI